MKRHLLFIVALCALCSCQQMIVFDVDYNVSLDKSNTYKVGEPVRFIFSGDVDNLVFFSGEPGHQYEYCNRYEVSLAEITAANLIIDYQPRWGRDGALDVYVSNTFTGLNGNDGEADRNTIKAMLEGGMNGWTKLDYTDGEPQSWETHTYDISSFIDNFSLAFHWHPAYTGTFAQRTYWLNGAVDLAFPGAESSLTFKDLDFVSVLMNEQMDPYLHTGNGSISLGGFSSEITFQGVGATDLDYPLEGWCISKPQPLNKVANDKGIVIKTLENYMTSYEYVFTEPGAYTVTFIGVNDNVGGRSESIKQMNIVIL